MKEASTGTLFWDPFERLFGRMRKKWNASYTDEMKPSYDLGRAGATHALRVLSSFGRVIIGGVVGFLA